MKRLFLACFLLTATCTLTFTQQVSAQMSPPPTVALADFTAKINLMDTYIGAGNIAMAQSTWTDVHNMMLQVLAVSKYSIYTAASPADKAAHTDILTSQTTLYYPIWNLKNDLATNRAAIHAKLVAFGATIY